MDWQRGEAGCLTWTHEGTRHGRKTEPPRLGGDPQTVGPLPGQLRRPRPDPLLRADDVHRTDGRRGVAARGAPHDRARRVDIAQETRERRCGTAYSAGRVRPDLD